MIATLKGEVSEKVADVVVIDVHGVGYGVYMTANTADRLAVGDSIQVYIYEQIKEDAHNLFGFVVLGDKKLFEQLLGVKNVGPKVAMAVLDIGSADRVRAAIAGGDVKQLQTAKGVGRRAAEQIVVELRDKVGLVVADSAQDIVMRSGVDVADEAVQALVALGYTELDASLALKGIDSRLTTEERITLALKGPRR